ncbi:hypothetical protein FQR65_LT10152 [Abscondita terminalis]|nr:hypothetical protein FQR65_LT10152 [Abscondita terminalis]
MCFRIILVIVFLSELQMIVCQESAQYLKSSIGSLEKINRDQSRRRIDTLQLKHSDEKLKKSDSSEKVPMLSLTKGELATLYESAVANQQYVKSEDPNYPYSNTVVHEIDEDLSKPHADHGAEESGGYYYYYYPLNSFMDHSHHSQVQPDLYSHHHVQPHHIDPDNQNALFHAHTHQHNVHITTTKSIVDQDKKKAMEPLFMAVSSFIGMAVMFVLSILFIPRFGGFKSRGDKQGTAPELTNIVQIIFKAIEGDDCSERVVCEVGKTAKAFNVHDNRFLKLMRRLSPKTIGWYVDRIEKYSKKNFKCATIQCRQKNVSKTKNPSRK